MCPCGHAPACSKPLALSLCLPILTPCGCDGATKRKGAMRWEMSDEWGRRGGSLVFFITLPKAGGRGNGRPPIRLCRSVGGARSLTMAALPKHNTQRALASQSIVSARVAVGAWAGGWSSGRLVGA